MTELSVRKYIAGDVNLITPRDAVAHEFAAMDAGLKAGGIPPGPAYTVQDRGVPIGCGGLIECWTGRWAAWTWVGDVRPRARAFVALACAGGIEEVRRFHGARRIESHVPLTMPMARRFNERLGFQVEGIARSWVNGSDYWAMALIIPEEADGD